VRYVGLTAFGNKFHLTGRSHPCLRSDQQICWGLKVPWWLQSLRLSQLASLLAVIRRRYEENIVFIRRCHSFLPSRSNDHHSRSLAVLSAGYAAGSNVRFIGDYQDVWYAVRELGNLWISSWIAADTNGPNGAYSETFLTGIH
jgi:hypothetical protein